MGKSLRVAFGETLAQLGAENDKIVALDADLANATQSKFFRDAFPERFFDMGIAEANMVDTAAGLAHDSYPPSLYSVPVVRMSRFVTRLHTRT